MVGAGGHRPPEGRFAPHSLGVIRLAKMPLLWSQRPAVSHFCDDTAGRAIAIFAELRASFMTPQIPAPDFDPAEALAAVRERRATARRRRTWGKSRLTPHRAELVKMRQAGGSFAELADWLRRERRVKMDPSSVRRFLQKLPELAAPEKAVGG